MKKKTRLFFIAAFTVLIIITIGSVILYIVPYTTNLIQNNNSEINESLEYNPDTIYFFYGEECPHCHEVIPFIQILIKKYPDVDFKSLEIWHNRENLDLSNKIHKELGFTSEGVPEVIIGKVILLGDKEIPDKLEGLIINRTKSVSGGSD